MIGRSLAHYEIVALLGKGGMGEVYRARDTKLGRDVAIKVLPSGTHGDAERVGRFRREARSLATLQHPNVASVYGFEDVGGERFLVMELVEGEDLAARLERGALGVDDAIEVARQIAAGLEAAHDKGVVHRDLKPANLKITPDGQVKILDFGLARAMHGEPEDNADLANSPTITGAMTQADTLLGTAAYMSPEQARGQTADRRADVWAFGVVVFEMLTGGRVFEGDTVSDKLAAILKTDPDFDALPADTPARLRDLLDRCLQKSRTDRMRDMGDVRIELERMQGAPDAAAVEASARRGPSWAVAALFAVVLAIGAAIVTATVMPSGSTDTSALERSPHRLTLEFPSFLDVEWWLVAEDDHLVVGGRSTGPEADATEVRRAYLRAPGAADFVPLPGSENHQGIAFSPDSRWIAMIAPDAFGTGNFLWRLPVDGSAPPLRIRPWDAEWGRGLAWLPDGDLLGATFDDRLFRLADEGAGEVTYVELDRKGIVNLDRVPASYASVLPGGEAILMAADRFSDEGYRRDLVVVDLGTGAVRDVVRNGDYGRWTPSGHILFSRGPTVLALEYDPVALEPLGQPFAVDDGLRTRAVWDHAEFTVSGAGHLYHVPGGLIGRDRRLAWTDRTLETMELWGDEGRAFFSPVVVSPDGSRLAVVLAAGNGLFETWISETDAPRLRRLAREDGRDVTPQAWFPDGSRLVVRSFAQGRSILRVVDVDGGSATRDVYDDEDEAVLVQIGQVLDGGASALGTLWRAGRPTIVVLDLREGAPDPSRTQEVLEGARGAQLSPDGRWMCYESESSGRGEVYVRRWLGDGGLGPEIQISTSGGFSAFWSPGDGGEPELTFGNENVVYAVALDARGRPGRPRAVGSFTGELLFTSPTRDGRILALLRSPDEAEPSGLAVTLDWTTILER